jgi:alanine dehydrogenase
MRVVSERDVRAVLELRDLVGVVEEALRAQGRGAVERPPRPHFPVGFEGDAAPAGTGLVMPAYVHGADHYATKLVGVHEGNAERGRPTVTATVALFEAATGRPVAYVAGRTLTNARTACLGAIAVRDLGVDPVTLGILGAGTQARWQVRAIATVAEVADVRIYSPSDSREHCAADLRDHGLPARAASSPREAVTGADAVVTATTSRDPVFPGDALAPGTVVVAVGAYTPEMRELDAATVERAARVFADVPGEAAETGDLRESGLDAEDLVELSAIVADEAGRQSDEEILVVESVGSAVFDAAAVDFLYERVRESGRGATVEL